ncbi:hypothetical protein N7532_009497 [Penicillium argentinense]|uniref:Phosphoglycerate mutase n=1 Tax=Penicillium argentinense TaxID=1131581 RepID=A0A9W9EZI0_9EURO|nr:uncharacterized protein N7532_009497 [Penicillium argentinense]KAJ5090813.1 hypothetical protein N7532_009497 [Penicillium argentinense]
MPPTLYVIRHGQGEHNVNDASHLRDPLLTAKGKEQCLELQQAFPVPQDISLILASPLQRTIQTAAYAFAPELDARNVSFILTPNAQEISGMNCDIGHKVDFIRETAPRLIHEAAPSWKVENLDTTLVKEDWNSKKGIYAPTLTSVRRRAAELRKWIWSRPEKDIVLVTHGGFLHYLTEDWTGYVVERGTGYQNCEYRKLEFTPESNAEEAHLVEPGSSREKQGRAAGLDAHVVREIEEVENAIE